LFLEELCESCLLHRYFFRAQCGSANAVGVVGLLNEDELGLKAGRILVFVGILLSQEARVRATLAAHALRAAFSVVEAACSRARASDWRYATNLSLSSHSAIFQLSWSAKLRSQLKGLPPPKFFLRGRADGESPCLASLGTGIVPLFLSAEDLCGPCCAFWRLHPF